MGGTDKEKHISPVRMIYNDDQWNRHTYTQPHTSPKYKQKCMTHDMTGICREGCFYTSSEGLCCTFFLPSCRNPLISLDSVFSSFLSLPVAPHSGGTLQCHSKWPPSNFWQHRRGQTGAPALSLDSLHLLSLQIFCLSSFFSFFPLACLFLSQQLLVFGVICSAICFICFLFVVDFNCLFCVISVNLNNLISVNFMIFFK